MNRALIAIGLVGIFGVACERSDGERSEASGELQAVADGGTTPDSGTKDCNDKEKTCLGNAKKKALDLIAAKKSCFDALLKKIGSSCTSDGLSDCITTYLKNAQLICKTKGDLGGSHDSKCFEEKAKQAQKCKDGNCIPAGTNCSACSDTSAQITIQRISDMSDLDYSYCRAEVNPRPDGKNNLDYLIGILLHEAAHACLGPHDMEPGGTGFVYNYGKDGVGVDACGRPDPYEIQNAFIACNGLNDDHVIPPPTVPANPKPPASKPCTDGCSTTQGTTSTTRQGLYAATDGGPTDAGDAGVCTVSPPPPTGTGPEVLLQSTATSP